MAWLNISRTILGPKCLFLENFLTFQSKSKLDEVFKTDSLYFLWYSQSFSPPPAQAGLFGSIKHDHLTNDWINILSCGFCFLLLIAFFIPILHFGPHHEVFPQSTPLLFSLYFNLQWIFFRNEFNSYLHTSYTSWVGEVYAFKSSL